MKGLFFVLLSVFLTKCSNRNLILIKDYEISFVLIRPFFFILNIVFAFKYSTVKHKCIVYLHLVNELNIFLNKIKLCEV